MSVVIYTVYSCEQCTAAEQQDMPESVARTHLEENPTHTLTTRVAAFVEDEPGV